MDLEKLEKMAKLVLKELSVHSESYRVNAYDDIEAEVKNLLQVANTVLPEHRDLFNVTYKNIDSQHLPTEIGEAMHVINHILKIVEIEKASEEKTREGRIFETAEDKLKQAAECFRKDDYPSALHSLNTSLELVLKHRLGIPVTITKINTAKIIDILVKHEIEPYRYLAEARKHVLDIDNRIKHNAYSPTKVDCISGIKAIEEVISRLRNKEIEVTDEVKDKIFGEL